MTSTQANVATMLAALGLERYVPVFEEEAITDVALLHSMGAEMLRENLEELGLDPAAIGAVAGALFPETESAAGPSLEEQPADRPAVPSGADAPTVIEGFTQEEITQAEEESQWLLNPLSMMDMTMLKEKLLKLTAAGIEYQKKGQFANARAVYTRALGMEAPNKRAAAALYYNRSACQRQLGQLQLALRDAQKAYEVDPTNTRAHWRAADVAAILGDNESAAEAVVAGLKHAPRNGPLLQLKLKLGI